MKEGKKESSGERAKRRVAIEIMSDNERVGDLDIYNVRYPP